jgi:hypothetical protein
MESTPAPANFCRNRRERRFFWRLSINCPHHEQGSDVPWELQREAHSVDDNRRILCSGILRDLPQCCVLSAFFDFSWRKENATLTCLARQRCGHRCTTTRKSDLNSCLLCVGARRTSGNGGLWRGGCRGGARKRCTVAESFLPGCTLGALAFVLFNLCLNGCAGASIFFFLW